MRSSLLIAAALFALVGCDSSPAPSGKVRVVATTGMVADLARSIGGDRVEVQALMGPGVDPHRYTATAGDLSKLAGADVILFNGLHLEGKMGQVLESGTGKQRRAAVTRGLNVSDLRKTEDEGGGHDPHVWFDPVLWERCVDVVRDELSAADPAHAAEFADRAATHRKEILAAHEECKALLAAVPEGRRVLVTSHDAFGYFGKRYGFRVLGLQGVSTASETSVADRQSLAKELGGNRIPAVFTETSVPAKGLEAVLESVKSEYKFTVKLVGGDDALYSDALGPDGSGAETYVGMIRHNARVIATALK